MIVSGGMRKVVSRFIQRVQRVNQLYINGLDFISKRITVEGRNHDGKANHGGTHGRTINSCSHLAAICSDDVLVQVGGNDRNLDLSHN